MQKAFKPYRAFQVRKWKIVTREIVELGSNLPYTMLDGFLTDLLHFHDKGIGSTREKVWHTLASPTTDAAHRIERFFRASWRLVGASRLTESQQKCRAEQ
jgi:hypothetical protein